MGVTNENTGPLAGVRVVELAGIGPAPHVAMMLADLGATVVQVQRPAPADVVPGVGAVPDGTMRGRIRVVADLKDPADNNSVRRLVDRADVLIEGFRPGVAERLGLGPETFVESNPGLIYGRMTGWGQTGPLADTVGHDINYISLTGVLDNIGPPDGPPLPPLNLVGDFGGGSMFLVAGILAALYERESSGLGQVIDAAIVDGTLVLGQMMWSLYGGKEWQEGRGENFLDGSVPFYTTYRTADDKYVAVGALEPKFFHNLLELLEIDPQEFAEQWDRDSWPALRERFAECFLQRTRDEWAEIGSHVEACLTPVLSYGDALGNAHLTARDAFVEENGTLYPRPAPVFSRTPTTPRPIAGGDEDLDQLLTNW